MQGVKHLLSVLVELIVGDLMGDIADRPPNVGGMTFTSLDMDGVKRFMFK